MFIELDLDDGIVILNSGHIVSIDIIERNDTYGQNEPTHFVLSIRTIDEHYFFKTFSVKDGFSDHHAYEYQDKLSRMLYAKSEKDFK